MWSFKRLFLFSFLLLCFPLSTYAVFGTWTLSGSDIYNDNSGNVGINQTSPVSQLDVLSNVSYPNTAVRISGSTSNLTLEFNNTASGGKDWWIYNGNNTGGAGQGTLNFYNNTDGGNALTLKYGGSSQHFIGINQSNPLAQLHVSGDFVAPYYGQIVVDANTAAVALVSHKLSTTQAWFFGSGSGANNNNFRIVNTTDDNFDVLDITPSNNFVGIATTTPTHRLTVVGDVNITGSYYINGVLASSSPGGSSITVPTGDYGQLLASDGLGGIILASTTMIISNIGDITFGLAIMIVLQSFMFIGFIYSGISRKKPWQK